MDADDLLDRLHVVALPMRVRFRGITVREVALINGPSGWGEFGAFLEYEPAEAAHWLASGIESAYGTRPSVLRDRIRVNATIPAVPAAQIPEVLARFPIASLEQQYSSTAQEHFVLEWFLYLPLPF
jgi:O-succinylbenzoate synthase